MKNAGGGTRNCKVKKSYSPGLEDLELHHIVVNTWEHGVDSEQNVVLISIASVMDPSLAPKGKHTLHAYLPATEPFEIWQHMKQGTPQYEQLKKERSQVLWEAVERVIPDIRQRTEIEMVRFNLPLCSHCYQVVSGDGRPGLTVEHV